MKKFGRRNANHQGAAEMEAGRQMKGVYREYETSIAAYSNWRAKKSRLGSF